MNAHTTTTHRLDLRVPVAMAVMLMVVLASGCSSTLVPGPQTEGTPVAPAATPVPNVPGEPTQTPEPLPTAALTTPATAPIVTAEITATAMAPEIKAQLLAATSITLPFGGLMTSSPSTESRFTFKSPQQGFGIKQPRKQSGTVADNQNSFVILFPELRTAPAPGWVKEGVRVTYRIESASIAQTADGKGSSGAGYAQYDFVAVDRQSAVTSVRFFTDPGDGILLPSAVMRFVGLPGAGEYWLNPKVLQNAERVANENLTVVHMPQKIGAKTYQTVRFQYKTQGAEYVWAFDAGTGLLVFYRDAIGDENAAYRRLTQITFVRQRQLKLPWRATTVPDWAIEGSQLTYDGTYSVILPGTDLTPLPYQVVAGVTQVAGRWTEWQLEASLQSQVPDKSIRATGVSQLFDGLWLPAEEIASLEAGQVLDRDPVTGSEITVSRGNGTVTLTETGSSHNTVLTYHENDGVLLSMLQETQNGTGTVRVELKLTDRK